MNLDSRDGAVACVAVGAALLAAPWYLDRLAVAGLDPVVDPLSALGVLPAGVFPVAVGAGYLVAGLLSLLFVGSEPLAADRVTVAGQAVVVAAVAAGAVALYSETGTLYVTPARAAITAAVASVPVAFVAGLGSEGRIRRWPIAALAALLVPLLVLLALTAYPDGAVESLVVDTVGPAAGALLVAAAVFGYPLFRLGRSFEVVVR